MTKVFLAAGVAALAITAPASAQRGENKGGDRAKVERGGGQARAARSEQRQARTERRATQRAERPARAERQQVRVARAERQEARPQRAERQQRVDRVERQEARQQRVERQAVRAQRNENRVDRRELRAQRVDNRIDRQQVRAQRVDNRIDRQDVRAERVANRIDRRELRQDIRANRIAQADVVRVRDWDDNENRWVRARGLLNACPPGLDKKRSEWNDFRCMPPGQAKKLLGAVIPAAYSQSLLPVSLRDVYRDDDDYYYRYGDGYVYRVERESNLIASLLPLFTGGYMPGQLFPTSYMNSYVPSYYQPFYSSYDDDYYRYANGYIYEVDGRTGLIEDIDPAFGYGYGVGQLMPASYSYYNVPYQYRSMYYDTDDYYYRYAPGAIYQVDRGSSLITAVASLLAGDLGVGSRLPLGYDVYNVPLSYRAQYYDTPNAWYRYNDGYIYQVDPTTRLITAVINALV